MVLDLADQENPLDFRHAPAGDGQQPHIPLFNKLDRWLRVARKLLSIASMTERFLASIERLISLLTWWMPQS